MFPMKKKVYIGETQVPENPFEYIKVSKQYSLIEKAEYLLFPTP